MLAIPASALALLSALMTAPRLAAPAPPDSAAPAAPDTTRPPRIWREFPPIEVRAPLHDLTSSETVHLVTPAALATMPADRLFDVVRAQAGVVADGDELHVRGGRAGELDQVLDGVTLNDPLDRRPMDVPLLALRSIDLVSGGQDAQHGGALAGVLELRTQDPGERWSTAWRYTTDGGFDTHYDQGNLRVGGPLPIAGLGVVAAADVSGDDTWLPAERTVHERDWLGLHLGWRAENRMLGWAKVAPIADPQRLSLQVVASREVHRPWDPAWTQDGWYSPCADGDCLTPAWAHTPPPSSDSLSWTRYRAADHLAITDERRIGAVLSLSRIRPDRRIGLNLGWVHASAVRSPDGRPGDAYLSAGGPPVLGVAGTWGNPFYVYFGNDPLYRETRSDQLSMRGDGTWGVGADRTVRAGLGLTYDRVAFDELDATLFGADLDSLRSFRAWAPGGFAYVQTRWRFEGMVLNAGLRGQAFSAGPQARGADGSVPRAILSLSPRLGVAYPVSTRDVFSLAYVRLQQDPAREFLYDNRRLMSNRSPLGNGALEPATAISYQAAIKHLFSSTWAAQLGTFYRDVYGEVGARNDAILPGDYEVRYTNEDESHAVGVEVSLLHESDRHRAELHYTWMQVNGSESRPAGDPYGLLRSPRLVPLGDRPLSWDRRHALSLIGDWPLFERWRVSWSSVLGSALPWTPKPREQVFDDPAQVNSARLGWTEQTDFSLRWDPPLLPVPLTLGLEVRNLFDHRGDLVATVDGYPHATINTLYDDYGAFRTETGRGGGAYWFDADGDGVPDWVRVHDPRLQQPPRHVRLSVGARW